MNLEGLQFEGLSLFQAIGIALFFGTLIAVGYFRSLATRPPLQRFTLTGFRMLAWLGMLWLALLPFLQRRHMEPVPPRVAVLLDRSPSMQLPLAEAGGPSRGDRAVSAIDGLSRESLRLEPYSFSSKLTRGLGADGGSSKIHSALAELRRKEVGSDLEAILLFTDGRTTDAGESPSDIPIYSIPTGPREAVDVSIEAEPLPPEVQQGQTLSIVGHLTRSDARVPEAIVELWSGQTLLESQPVRFAAGVDQAEVRFSVQPEADRFLGYRLVVQASGGLTASNPAANNVAYLATSATSDRTQVLVLAARAGFESAFLGRQLAQEAGLRVFRAVGLPGGRLVFDDGRTGGLELLAPLRQYAAILVVGTEALTWIQADLPDFLRQGGGLLVLAGPSDPETALQGLAPGLLPVQSQSAHVVRGVFAAGSVAGVSGHPLLEFLSELPDGAQALKALPPMEWLWTGMQPLAGAQILLEATAGGRKYPLLLAQRYGLGRVGLLTGGPLWNWRFQPVGSKTGKEEAFVRLMPRLARWTAAGGEFRRFSLRVRGRDASEPLQILVGSLQEDLKPARGESVFVDLSSVGPDGQERLILETELFIGSGGTAEWNPLLREPGHYRVRAHFEGRTTVREAAVALNFPRGELTQVTVGMQTLQSLSQSSGGRIVEIGSLDQLVQEISTQKRSFRMLFERTLLWSDSWLLAAILLLLAAEWGLRRLWSLP